MQSTNVDKTIELHPVDQYCVAEEKFKELQSKDPEDQATQFSEQFVYILKEDGVKKGEFVVFPFASLRSILWC